MLFGRALSYALITLANALTIATAYAGCDANQSAQPRNTRYVIKGGEVYDTQTRLTWQRCSVGQRWKENAGCVGVIRQMTWQQAMSQASDGWRVPDRDELSTLISPACKNPAIDEQVFPDMELTKLWYWTSSENDASAWYVAFGGGSIRSGGRMDLNAVRLMRRGR